MQPFDWSISRDSHILLKDKNLYDQLTPVAGFKSSESLCAFFLQKSALGLHNSYQISFFDQIFTTLKILSEIKGIRDAGSIADFRILFEILKFRNLKTFGKFQKVFKI